MRKTLESIIDNVIKIVISNNIDSIYNKIVILKKNDNYLVEKYTSKQVFHEKINFESLITYIEEISSSFKQINLWDLEYEYIIKKTKKSILFSKSKIKNKIEISNTHNREKNYILKEGMIIEPLIDLGIMTSSGKIINSMYDKYKQINRFIEIINDSIKDETKLNILDFGCGKSYLTFVLYYYLTNIKKIDVNIIGLDLKEDVIDKCNSIAHKYNYSNLSFQVGDINNYINNNDIDMIITLHACDVATDYALYNAIKWNVKYIFSVPCCQHELNSQIKTDNYSIITKYGLAKEKISSMLTDIIRCNLLTYSGYKTQLLEFIDLEHTDKNIMIRSVKTNIPSNIKSKNLKEVEDLIKEFNLNPTLYKMLIE